MTAVLPAAAGPRDDDWRDRALCREVDPELFFPGKGDAVEPAKQVCVRCEVREVCLTDALGLPPMQDFFGVRGGLSAVERRRLRRTL
jgi:WhiB family transcriptional regulator, redox-sensing transcriptional regulator